MRGPGFLVAAFLAGACAGPGGLSRPDAARPTAPRAAAGPSTEAAPAEPDPARLRAFFTAHADEVQRCYEARLAKRPDLAGEVLARLDVAPDGTVKEAAIARSTVADPEVEGCIVARLRAWTLPVHAAEGFELEVPFALRPAPAGDGAAGAPGGGAR